VNAHPPAYEVWLCGECDSHTVDKDNGDHLCETCGSLYDNRGTYIPDPDDEPEEES
jgi:hypothetical protein